MKKIAILCVALTVGAPAFAESPTEAARSVYKERIRQAQAEQARRRAEQRQRTVDNQVAQQQNLRDQGVQAPSKYSEVGAYNGRKAGAVNRIASQTDSALAVNEAPQRDTINRGSQAGESSQDSGAMLNMAASAALFAACLAPKPPAMSLCAMGALAAMQGAADKSAANDSYKVNLASTDGLDGAGRTEDQTGTGGFDDPLIRQGMDAMGEAGYKVTADGVTLPDGSFQAANSFSSPAAMAAAGMDPSAIAQAAEITAALNEEAGKVKASVSGMPIADSAGGGASSDGGGSDGDGGSYAGGSRYNPFALGKDQQKKMVAGKTVLFDGEPIGVRGNNIFDMVHTAYQSKRKKNHFIEGEGVSTRSPASLPARKKHGKR